MRYILLLNDKEQINSSDNIIDQLIDFSYDFFLKNIDREITFINSNLPKLVQEY